MKEALTALDQVSWTEEMAAVIEVLGLTEADISLAVGKLTEAHRYIVNHNDVTEPVHALEKAGWYGDDVNPGARYLIYGRLGEVLFGGFFIALRDTSEFADESSQATEIADFIAAGKLVMERGSGKAVSRSEAAEISHLQHKAEAELQGCRDALQLAREKITRDAKETVGTISDLTESNKRLGKQVTDRDGLITSACNMGFWRTIWWIFQKPLTRKLWLTKTSGQAESTPS
jgi:hypothetical protein